ncbi:hypothetical protein CCH79_00002463 [Gambusia affinis]|uniref:Major facilitator superfamily (MFS) profile domain-containing protein n=1 Tax=Gambusia affinis TaxID=33528 RepID=A0A315VH84_GAMAF|nr:hypothetical protein CCH79_00002463 [Gambusia affinis]
MTGTPIPVNTFQPAEERPNTTKGNSRKDRTSREFNSLTSSMRLQQTTNKEQSSRMIPMAKSDREESANRCLPDRETEMWNSYSYSQPEDTKLTAMEVDVEELWTKTVTRIPTITPATGLDKTAFFWKISPAALPYLTFVVRTDWQRDQEKNQLRMKEYEEIVAFLDQWGCFQKVVFFLLCASIIPNGFGAFNLVFLTDVPDHHCFLPDLNVSEEWRKSIIPKTFDLVCDDQWVQPFTTSVFFIGVLVGSFFSGQLSDRYGRKPILFATLAAQIIFTFAQVFSTSWTMFVILLFFNGLGQISNFVAALVLGAEVLTDKVRILYSSMGTCLGFAVGYMLLPVVAYFLRDWKSLLVALSLPCLVYIPLWWLLPESPRWLLSRGRVKEAEAVIRKAARWNKVQTPTVIFETDSRLSSNHCLKPFNKCIKDKGKLCIWLMVSGRGIPKVSGRSRLSSAVKAVRLPTMMYGRDTEPPHECWRTEVTDVFLSVKQQYGATMLPILEAVEQAPTAVFLSTVGYSSAV